MDHDQSGRPGDPSNEPSGRKERSASRYQLGEPILFVADTEMIHRLGVPERTERTGRRQLVNCESDQAGEKQNKSGHGHCEETAG